MNIKDLPQGSYKVIAPISTPSSGNLNVNNLPKGSYKTIQQPSISPSGIPTQDPTHSSFMEKLSGLLGVEKFGQGLATAGRVATGSINKTGDQEAEAVKQLNAIMGKYPPGSPERKRAMDQYHQTYAGGVPTQAEIDPGSALSNKEVLGSAANVALNVAAAGLPGPKSLLAKTVEGGALGYGFDVAQKSTDNKKNVLAPGLGTAIGVSLPFASKLIGALGKRAVGITTGAGTDVIQRAVDNPDAVNQAIKEYAKTPELKQGLVDRAKAAMNDFLSNRGEEFSQSVSTMKAKRAIPKSITQDAFTEEVGKFKGSIKEGQLVFGDTSLTPVDQRNLKNAWATISKWKDVTPQGYDTLRQAIGNFMEDYSATNNPRANVVLGNVKQKLTEVLTQNISGYGDTLSTYGNKTSLARNLMKELNMSSNAKPSTQINSILRIFKKDPQVTKDLGAVMGKDEADRLLNELSGAILSEWIPAGKVGNAVRLLGEAGILGLGGLNPATGTTAAVGLAASSPRIVGKASTIAGKAIQKGVGTGTRRAASRIGSKAD